MKALVLVMSLVLSNASFAAVDSAAIQKAYVKMSKASVGSKIYKVEVANPYMMLKTLAAKKFEQSGEDFRFEKDVPTGADGATWGTISMRAALLWVRTQESLSEREQEVLDDAIRSLIGSGVVFGLNPNGPIQCGITLPTLLLIDTEAGVIYELALDEAGSC